MRVLKWTPNFRIDAETSIAPIWVNFHQLHVHFFRKQSLFSIAGTLGSSMKTDAATASLNRPNVARVCVEMDILKKFPRRIWVGCGSGGFWQSVEYEYILKYCTKCLRQGHESSECQKYDNKRTGDVVVGVQI